MGSGETDQGQAGSLRLRDAVCVVCVRVCVRTLLGCQVKCLSFHSAGCGENRSWSVSA